MGNLLSSGKVVDKGILPGTPYSQTSGGAWERQNFRVCENTGVSHEIWAELIFLSSYFFLIYSEVVTLPGWN